MNKEATPRVISATIQQDLDETPSPEGLMRLSETFEFAGYTKLARYLRRCGDALSAKPAPHSGEPRARVSLVPVAPEGQPWHYGHEFVGSFFTGNTPEDKL